jgi:glycolate oxidase FAD binding subunit
VIRQRTATLTELLIDGIQPRHQLRVESVEQLADLLAGVIAGGGAVVPVGGGTALGLGNVPKEVQASLALTGLDRVLDYEPSDMMLSVEAGMTMTEIQETLGEHGQYLALDVAFPEKATIGGVIATAFAGPRRLTDGTLRDQLVGATFVRSDGAICKAGGKVVKNVSGFDLARALHGSLGTLAIIASVNLKVLPAPKEDATLVAHAEDTDQALGLCRQLLLTAIRPTALDISITDDGAEVAARFTGGLAGVEHLCDENRAGMEAAGLVGIQTLSGAESAQWWQSALDERAAERPDIVQIHATMRPSAVEGYLARLRPALVELAPDARLTVSPGVATVHVAAPMRAGASQFWLASLRQAVAAGAESAVIACAPASVKHDLDVWGETPPDGLEIMRALKREMDPREVLNTGRYVGFI